MSCSRTQHSLAGEGNYFEFGLVVSKEMSFYNISIYSSGSHYVQQSKSFCNFGRGHYKKQFYEIIKILGQWFSRFCSKIFLYLALVAICSEDQNHVCNFSREHYEKPFCDFILNMDQLLRRILCWLNIYLF